MNKKILASLLAINMFAINPIYSNADNTTIQNNYQAEKTNWPNSQNIKKSINGNVEYFLINNKLYIQPKEGNQANFENKYFNDLTEQEINKVEYIYIKPDSNITLPKDSSNMFSARNGFKNLKAFDLKGLTVSEDTNMNGFFIGLSSENPTNSFEYIDLSNLKNFENVKKTSGMFAYTNSENIIKNNEMKESSYYNLTTKNNVKDVQLTKDYDDFSPQRAKKLINSEDLPENTKYEFTKVPNTHDFSDNEQINIKATFEDGSSVGKTIDTKIVGDNSKYNVNTKDLTFNTTDNIDIEKAITNIHTLPENTQIKYEIGKYNEVGKYENITFDVVYPDGSFEESQPFNLTIVDNTILNKIEIINNPTLNLNDKIEDNQAINFIKQETIPENSEIKFKEKPSTTVVGKSKAIVEITTQDGHKREIEFDVNITNNEIKPVLKDFIELEANNPIEAKDLVENVSEFDENTTFEFKHDIDFSKSNQYSTPIIVKSNNNKYETNNVVINIKEVEKQKEKDLYEPQVQDITIETLDKINPDDIVINKNELPEDIEYSLKTVINNTKADEKQAVLIVKYSDESIDEKPFNITIKNKPAEENNKKDNEKYIPTAEPLSVIQNENAVAEKAITNLNELPENTIVEFKETSDTSQLGTFPISIIVKYPDESIDEMNISMNVLDSSRFEKDKDKFNLQIQDITVNQNDTPLASDAVVNKEELPENTIFHFKEHVDTSNINQVLSSVVATYPDGSTQENEVNINVIENDKIDTRTQAEKYNPIFQNITTNVNEQIDIKKAIVNINELPDNVYIKLLKDINTDKHSIEKANVLVVYEDGSVDSEEIEVNVSDNRKDNEIYNPVNNILYVKKNSSILPKETIANISELPEQTMFEFKNKPNTSLIGTNLTKLLVIYPDGSRDELDISYEVIDQEDLRKDSERYKPTINSMNVILNEKPKAEDLIGNKRDLPQGVIIDFNNEVDTSQLGQIAENITLTYPDGSVQNIVGNLNVINDIDNRRENEKYQPKTKDIIIDRNKNVNVLDVITNKENLPKDIQFQFRDNVETFTIGQKQVYIQAIYNDNSVDLISFKLTVMDPNERFNVKYKPLVKDLTIEENENVKAEDFISNINDIPESTKFKFKNNPNLNKLGNQTLTIITEYEDETINESKVNLTINKKTSEKNIETADKEIDSSINQNNETNNLMNSDTSRKGLAIASIIILLLIFIFIFKSL